jgi:hypothetical protein
LLIDSGRSSISWRSRIIQVFEETMSKSRASISQFANSVGLLVDRCVKREEPFGTVWMVGPDQFATCAHLVVLYEEHLSALKVRFPALSQEWEVVDIMFHPRFDRKAAYEMAQRSLSDPVPALPLQEHNLAVLKLARNLSPLDLEFATTFNKRLSLPALPARKGLGGPLEELGLALLIQTMTSSGKDGVLVIADERNRPLAKLFCRQGKVVYAKYRSLSNDFAIYQMFGHNLSGQFSFQTQSRPDWEVEAAMSRTTEGMLIEAHKRMDEMPAMLKELGGPESVYIRTGELFNGQAISQEVRQAAEAVWRRLDGGICIDQLWEVVRFDNYTVYQALIELANSRQAIEVPSSIDEDLRPLQPLSPAPHVPLSAWDEVLSLTVHPLSGRAQMRSGHLIGLLRPNDPYHIIHNIGLPYRDAGSPIFREDQLVGMHCGMLPLDPRMHALPNHLYQMLWVESIQQCLQAGGKKNVPSKPSKKSIGMAQPAAPERISCPRCNSSMLKHAKFCGTCGHRLS